MSLGSLNRSVPSDLLQPLDLTRESVPKSLSVSPKSPNRSRELSVEWSLVIVGFAPLGPSGTLVIPRVPPAQVLILSGPERALSPISSRKYLVARFYWMCVLPSSVFSYGGTKGNWKSATTVFPEFLLLCWPVLKCQYLVISTALNDSFVWFNLSYNPMFRP